MVSVGGVSHHAQQQHQMLDGDDDHPYLVVAIAIALAEEAILLLPRHEGNSSVPARDGSAPFPNRASRHESRCTQRLRTQEAFGTIRGKSRAQHTMRTHVYRALYTPANAYILLIV